MADFYGTVSGYQAYHTARGREAAISDQDDDEILASLLVASEWLDGRYFVNFAGTPTGQRAQVRQWPRDEAYDNKGYYLPNTQVPREVENATYEAAFRQLTNAAGLSVDYTPSKYKSASVAGAVSVEFAAFTSAYETQMQIPVIDAILAPLLSAPGSGVFSSYSGAAVRV